jgi:uncharacterized protein YcbX
MASNISISALYTYPVKSCGALQHEQMILDERGPLWDRRWMVVDADGIFVTQRSHPTMAIIQPSLSADTLTLTAPGMPALTVPLTAERDEPLPVTIWQDTCDAWDEGRAAAEWFSHFLEGDLRLVRMTDGWFRPVNPKYAPETAQTGFSDGFPLLLVSEESLADLNTHLQAREAQPVPMSRFRPNVVVRGASPYAEDGWRTVQVGAVTLDVLKPCARCVITTVDQHTGSIPDNNEPLGTLSTYRKQNSKVMFAQNAVHRAAGTLALGAVVEVLA